MKHISALEPKSIFNRSIEHLHKESIKWLSEVKFIQVEQRFFKELLTEHIMKNCDSVRFKVAKLYLNGIEHEYSIGSCLSEEIENHKVNLALLLENIYLKRENIFRQKHDALKGEIGDYIENFKYIKEKVFEIIIKEMRKK